jgi:hypothetical protein
LLPLTLENIPARNAMNDLSMTALITLRQFQDFTETPCDNLTDARNVARILWNVYRDTRNVVVMGEAFRWDRVASALVWLASEEHALAQELAEDLSQYPEWASAEWNEYYSEDLTDHDHSWRCVEVTECPCCGGLHCSAALRCECGTWLTLSKVG